MRIISKRSDNDGLFPTSRCYRLQGKRPEALRDKFSNFQPINRHIGMANYGSSGRFYDRTVDNPPLPTTR